MRKRRSFRSSPLIPRIKKVESSGEIDQARDGIGEESQGRVQEGSSRQPAYKDVSRHILQLNNTFTGFISSALLMTLSIFRTLATECRRDIALLSPSLMSSVKETLDAVPTDLEVIVRAASLVRVPTTVSLPMFTLFFLVHCLDHLYRWPPHRDRQQHQQRLSLRP